MSGKLENVDNRLRSSFQTNHAGLFERIGQFVLFNLFDRRMVQTDDGGVEVEVGVRRCWVSQILWQAQLLGQKHENAGQSVV